VSGRAELRPKRSSGELYDLIWLAELPPIMDERDTRAPAVAEAVARLILMAMAKFTNPTRDQILGPAYTWQCFAAVGTIAELANASERQVQRVLRVFEREGYIVKLEEGRRPGRPANGEEPGRARPSKWSLRPDQWPSRSLRNRTGIVAISSENSLPVPVDNTASARNSVPVPEEVAPVKTGLPENRDATGQNTQKSLPVLSPEPGTSFNPEYEEPVQEPAAVATAAPVTSGDFPSFSNGQANGDDVGHTRVNDSSQRPSSPAAQPSLDRMLTEVPRPQRPPPAAPVSARCMKCQARENEPARPDCKNPFWHVAAHAGTARLEDAETKAVQSEVASSTSTDMAVNDATANDAAAIRARLSSKLSAEELAHLDELEHQRVTLAEERLMPAVDDQVQDSQSGRSQPGVAESPRRRRRRKEAAAVA